jgi:uncharacterized protein (TIGR00661 family)
VRILYGVCGEGMGHAVRSAVVGRHLAEKGHEVTFVCAKGRAYDHLVAAGVGQVAEGSGLSMEMKKNRVDYVGTAVSNAWRMLGAPLAIASLRRLPKPELVISDFEPWTARFAGMGRLPLVAIDNVHFASRCEHAPGALRKGDRDAAGFMRPVVDNMVPNASHYMVTTIAKAPVTAPRTTLHAPILRDAVLALGHAPADRDGHVVVYFNDRAEAGKLFETLGACPADFRVYGLAGVKASFPKPNVEVVPVSDAFLADVGSSRAVIGGAGFTLMSEAIHLGKPMLAVPFGNQGEQILNANYLTLSGFGDRADTLSVPVVRRFLGHLPEYGLALTQVRHDRNRELFQTLDRLVESYA